MSLLGLAAGCQTSGGNDKAEAAPAPIVQSKGEAPATHETAIDYALAREGSGATTTAVPGDETANLSGVAVNSSAPLTYTVKRGDTLWGISAMYLRDPWLWPEIWHVNPSVTNPHLIFPGDQLTLATGANGQPELRLVRGAAVRVTPMVRSEPLDGAIATIPYEAIEAFLGRPTLLSREDLRNAPVVVGMRDRHIAAGTSMQVYVQGLDRSATGRYSIVHPGEELKDPETGAHLGYLGHYTATAQIEPTGSKLSRAYLLESLRETIKGDVVFPEKPAVIAEDIVPRAPPAGMTGQIVGIVNGLYLIGSTHVIAINRGTRDGLEAGHVLAIDQRGEVVRDPICYQNTIRGCYNRTLQLPDERAGTLLVFKTYEHMSYGLVVNATAEMRVADRVREP